MLEKYVQHLKRLRKMQKLQENKERRRKVAPAKIHKRLQLFKSRCFWVVCVGIVLRFSKEHVWNKVNHVLGCLAYLLETTCFSSAVQGRGCIFIGISIGPCSALNSGRLQCKDMRIIHITHLQTHLNICVYTYV